MTETPIERDRIEPVELQVEMQRSYIDYAMSVIVSRALPDVRDGLKPVHRRVLYAMYDGGYVYLAQPPLYKIKWTNAPHELAYSDRERDALLEAGKEAGHRLPKEASIQRYKGLGEMNDNELWDTTMDPDARILRQVTLEDAAMADEMFTILMGEDVEQRRHFIQRNAKDVRFLDI